MAYTKTTWVNSLAPPINATNLNKIEDGIFDNDAAITTLDGTVSTLSSSITTLEGTVSILDSTIDNHIQSIFPHFGYAFTQEIIYTGDNITQIDSKISTVLRLRESITYVADQITEINIKVFDTDGITILQEFTDTVSYDDDKIDEITRVVI